MIKNKEFQEKLEELKSQEKGQIIKTKYCSKQTRIFTRRTRKKNKKTRK